MQGWKAGRQSRKARRFGRLEFQPSLPCHLEFLPSLPSAFLRCQYQFVAVAPAGLNENVICLVSFAPSVTLWVIGPSFSCHASIV